MSKIIATPGELMDQAPDTINKYLGSAVKSIDRVLGSGYAAKHPELISAYIQACSLDFATALITSGLQDIAEALSCLKVEISEP